MPNNVIGWVRTLVKTTKNIKVMNVSLLMSARLSLMAEQDFEKSLNTQENIPVGCILPTCQSKMI